MLKVETRHQETKMDRLIYQIGLHLEDYFIDQFNLPDYFPHDSINGLD